MKTRILLASAALAASLFTTGAIAQDAATPPSAAAQNDTARLMDQILKSQAKMETEKNKGALKKELAEHATLLKELQTQLNAHPQMMGMGMMPGMKMNGDGPCCGGACPMADHAKQSGAQ